MNIVSLHRKYLLAGFALVILCLSGCGTTLSRNATEQLLSSDAIDQAVASVDFRDLAGQKVFFNAQYIKNIKGQGFVNGDYIISSLRQQMIAANLHLQDKMEDADFIVEGRVGTLGANAHEVTYGIPQSTAISTAVNTAASMVPTMPAVPALPELSVAKKNDQMAASKISLFAYHRQTGKPVWQSGIATARSTAKDTWIFGAGPFQRGTIYEGVSFAGSRLGLPLIGESEWKHRPVVDYKEEYHFDKKGLLASELEKQTQKTKTTPTAKLKPAPPVSPEVSSQLKDISTRLQQVNSGKAIAPIKPNSKPGTTSFAEEFPWAMKSSPTFIEQLPPQTKISKPEVILPK